MDFEEKKYSCYYVDNIAFLSLKRCLIRKNK